jgi:non-ribosomal peptide synthetase-like protein
MNYIVEPRPVTGLIAGPRAPDLLRDERLHEIVAKTAARTPRAVALRFGDMFMTYEELDRLAGEWACGLRALGARPGRVVGVWCERGPALLVMVLAVLKSGAAFLPFDAFAPAERVAGCLEDASACLLVTDEAHHGRVAVPRCAEVGMDSICLAAFGEELSAERPDAESVAYIIYTSGSTGKPKGVAISHKNICHLVRSENAILRLNGSDVVYQGFSIAFDMALEEIFITWLAGACLYVASAEEVRNFDRLPALLTERRVSVLHCVPSMLAMLEGEMPTLRLINVGGEACPDALVQKFWRPDRRMLNTYGPTETTVTATAAELHPKTPVTIGVLLPNYTAMICDSQGRPVPEGELGELYIGGPGVGLGYVNRPELTAEKFLPAGEFWSAARHGAFFYRTGDAARLNAAGQLELQGRLDSQVKHRGFRIELGEIEQALMAQPGVRGAVAMLRGEGAGEFLAAVISREDGGVDEAALKVALQKTLPCYMVPAVFLALPELPRLVSGKLDRQACAKLDFGGRAAPVVDDPDHAECLAGLRKLFGHRPVAAEDDFFTDLGGHSLLAAALVSGLRQAPRFAGISLQDVYELRNAAKISEKFPAGAAAQVREDLDADEFAVRRHALCTVAQALALVPIFGLAALEFLAPYAAFEGCLRHGMFAAAAAALAGFAAVPAALMVLAVAAKWLLLGRVRAGRHRLWGGYFFRWWLVQRLLALADAGVFADSPLMALFYRALGARIGRGAHLGDVTMNAPDLMRVGQGASLGGGVALHGARIDAGWLVLEPISIGEDAYVGTGCVLEGGSAVGQGAELANLSLLNPGVNVPDGEFWAGSPACRRGPAAVAAGARPGPGHFGFAVVALGLLPLAGLLPMLPGLCVLAAHPHGAAMFAPLIGALYVLCLIAEVTALRWLLLGRVQAGVHDTASWFYLRKWTLDRVLGLALTALHPLYASLYMPAFFRALGARVGRGAEISTAASVTHGLLDIGDGAFVADGVVLGDSEIRGGRLTLRQTVLGSRAFLGNFAVVPDGVRIGDDALVGCLSVPPADGLPDGQSCMGSPALMLPRRQGSQEFEARLIDRPGAGRIAARLAIETFRILLPRAAVVAMIFGGLDAWDFCRAALGFWGVCAVPLIYGGIFAAPALALCVALKWAMAGRYKAAEYPLWSASVWRSEAVTAVYEALAVPLALRHLQGTALLPAALKLFGAKMGRRVYLDTTDLTEFDMVCVGDDAVLDTGCGPQTHLFEDRVMKMGGVVIGAGARMGAMSLMLPGSELAPGARLGALSMVMKGETIPAGGRWAGLPVVAGK